MKQDAIILLGLGRSAKEISDLLESEFPELVVIRVSQTKPKKSKNILTLEPQMEISQIKAIAAGKNILGVINRFDTSIPLHGKIVDAFGLPGPSLGSISYFRDKSKLHQLMIDSGLSKFRPRTNLYHIDDFLSLANKQSYPFAVKPIAGAKSRGVFIIREQKQIVSAHHYLKAYFSSQNYSYSGLGRFVLVEDYVDGRQLTPTAYVDESGQIKITNFVDVYSGKDLNQKHQQLVYRTVPARVQPSVFSQIKNLLQQLVDLTGLRSTFIHPEFLVTADQEIILLEINVRLGGFRQELTKYSTGIDLNRQIVQLSLGERIESLPSQSKSVTAVEVWETKSGKLKQLLPPTHPSIRQMQLKFQPGDIYTAPPKAQRPLAQFYVVDDHDSLSLAGKLREEFTIELE